MKITLSRYYPIPLGGRATFSGCLTLDIGGTALVSIGFVALGEGTTDCFGPDSFELTETRRSPSCSGAGATCGLAFGDTRKSV